ncbi:unnamed protein product [Hymenolepis diminuta]|uniref:SUMO specific peptidase 6 n=1 Tax=Hymenolepis diminuta TaxID=6216 RepID=A0A0R3SBM9_HYMDI|nr:unnamed protein product [Hymenolepis diminuta]
MDTRGDVLKKNKKSPGEKRIRRTIQFNPDTTGLDSRGRKLKWSGDLSKVQVNLNNIFVKNAVSFAPTIRIHPPSSTSQDSASKKDKTSESTESPLAKFCNPEECRTQHHKHKQDCSKYPPEPTVCSPGQDEEKTEEESEESSLPQRSASNSKSESQCD